MTDNRNFIIAIVLSIAVLIGWQYFFAGPEIDQARQQQQTEQLQQQATATRASRRAARQQRHGRAPAPAPQRGARTLTRDAALAQSPRVDDRDAARSPARSTSPAGGSTTSASTTSTRPSRRRARRSSCSRRRRRRTAISPSSAGSATRAAPAVPGRRHGVDRAGRREADDGDAGDAHLGQRRRPRLHADHRARRELHVHGHRRGRRTTTGAAVTLTPYGRVTRLGEAARPHGYFILHEGLIGVFGDKGLQEVDYSDLAGDAEFKAHADVDQRLARHHRQVLGDGAGAAAQGQTFTGRFARTDAAERSATRPTSSATAVSRRRRAARRERRAASSPAPSRSRVVDGYQEKLGIERFELLIDWGWFYFITKPMFYLIDWFFRLFGNFGLAILAVTVIVKARLLPARQPLLRVDERDEEGAAGDGGAPGALQGRQGQAAAGDDGALQEGEDQPARRLLADRDPDPGVLRALQGAVRHHRDAARAVLRLDPGPLGARSDHDLHPVRADPVDAAAAS